MGVFNVGSAGLGLLVVVWVAAGVGASLRWRFRQLCLGAFAMPVVAFAVFTWPLGPLAIAVGALFVKYRAKLKRLLKRVRANRELRRAGTEESSPA